MAVNGLFVSSRGFLSEAAGGVQLCTREFIEVLGAAGITLTLLPVDDDRRWTTRLLRQVNSSPFFRLAAPAVLGEIKACAERTRFDYVFLNQEALSELAGGIRHLMPEGCRIVVLSHGLEITDLVHTIHAREHLPVSLRIRPTPAVALGSILMSERRTRNHVDAVCAISPFDADLERWLGTRRVAWLPRMVKSRPLDWQPVERRLGFVGTLDHAPNLDGLVKVLEVLAEENEASRRVRIVGGSPRIGEWLTRTFPNADVLGQLPDRALEAEAASWTAFIHPIFCLPRGCSTKLATAIAWQIPVVTTAAGRRGYVWERGQLLEAQDPRAFVGLCRSLDDPAVARQARQDVMQVGQSSPSLPSVATMMRGLLESIPSS